MNHDHYNPEYPHAPPEHFNFDRIFVASGWDARRESGNSLSPAVEQLVAAPLEEVQAVAVEMGTQIVELRGEVLGGGIPVVPGLELSVQQFVGTPEGQRVLFVWFAQRATLLDALSDNLISIIDPDGSPTAEDLLEFARVCDRILERCRTAITRRYLNALGTRREAPQ